MGTNEGPKEYAAGFAAGVATVITGHPFDTVKVKLQTHNTTELGKKYRNALHCSTQILRNEGFYLTKQGAVSFVYVLLDISNIGRDTEALMQVRGLYRGATSSFIGMAFESSLIFGIYSQMKQSLQGEGQNSRPQLQVIVPSAAYGGSIISFILCPAELVKCRMQVQGIGSAISKYERYNGPLDCALKTVKSEGIKGIFRGGFATLLRESIGNAAFFSTYEYSRYYMHSQLYCTPSSLSHLPELLNDVGIGIISGGLSGIAYWSIVLPLDVAKTVIQTAPDANSSRNPFQTLTSIYRRVGLRGCYAGLGPTLMRAFPANAAAIVTWELTGKILGIKRI